MLWEASVSAGTEWRGAGGGGRWGKGVFWDGASRVSGGSIPEREELHVSREEQRRAPEDLSDCT